VPNTAKLSFETSTALENILVDPNLMEQVFKELCVNAVRAGGETVQIVVKVNERLTELCISFRDNGPGISLDQKEQLFEPIIHFEGRWKGLGLATIRRIVEAHGGRIQVGESDVGANFIIRLPRKGE
jgi:signal transduction histidine kinase